MHGPTSNKNKNKDTNHEGKNRRPRKHDKPALQIPEKNYYAAYSQNKLMRSGDVEEEPGPMKINCTKILLVLFLTSLLLLITGISCYNRKETEDMPRLKQTTKSFTSLVNRSLDFLRNLLILRNNRKNKHIKIKTRAAYLVILLLLAGDIQLNPGPANKGNCLSCKNQENNKPTLECESCKGWSHVCCTGNGKNETCLINKSYEWLCPNPTCSPNYHPSGENTPESNSSNPSETVNISQNRYTILQKIKGDTPRRPRTSVKPRIKTKPKLKQKKEINLLKELTKIKPEEYKGKDICNECNKKIRDGAKHINCVECERCTHLKCSYYKNKSTKEKRITWTCNRCLRSEDLPENIKFSLNDFNVDETKITTIEELREMKKEQKKSKLWIHFNCRSLQNAYDEILAIIVTLCPDVILLTETWLDDSNPKTAFIPKGYVMKRKDRSEDYKHKYGKESGGGVAILHKENIDATIMQTLNTEEDEILWVKVRDKMKTVLYACAYRTSYCDLLQGEYSKLERNIVKASSISKNIVMFGDFNCDLKTEVPDLATKRLTTCMREMNLIQKVKGVTRMESGEGKLIDHIWVDEQMDDDIGKTGVCTGVSDHAGIFAFIKAKDEEDETITCRSYKNYDKEKLCEDFNLNMENSEFQTLIDEKKMNKATECWTKCFQKAIDNNAPMITFKKKEQLFLPWFSEELRTMIQRKNSRLKLWYLYRKSEDRTVYRKLKNQVNHLKKKLKSEHYSTQIENLQGKPRLLWNLYREITGNTKNNECIQPDFIDKEKANSFNQFFATIGSNIQEKLHISAEPPSLPESGFEFKYETEETIHKLISRIKIDIATGNDNINARFLRDAIDTITPSITKLVNLSYETKTFPNKMKEAVVRPIYKKEDKEKPEYYRPVSILPVLSKVFERSATNQLMTYLEENKLLSETQHAYRKGHSTITCLADLVDEIRKRRDQNETVGIIGMDLSKAFDSINHNILLKKLKDMGLGPNVISWMKSYLKERKQQVKFKHIISDQETVTSGVPQGSILGPVLFIMFTNSLSEHLNKHFITSYADDSQILISAASPKEMKEKIEEVMQIAQEWYSQHSLLNNLTKTEIMIITSKNKQKIYKHIVYTINENGITSKLKGKDNLKILGVWMDEDLTWNKQVSSMKTKAFNNARNLCRVNHQVPMKTKINLYNSYVASQLSYADIIWGGCNEENKQKLQKVQNFSLRSMTGKASSTEARNSLNFLTLEEKRKIHYGVYGYKLTHGIATDKQTAEFKKYCATSKRLREKGTMKPPKHNTQQFKMSTLYKTITEWNEIPPMIKDAVSMESFKNKLQNWRTK